ncbi:MAG: cytochrome C oxidase subunit II [Gammaproteobacteria bacterium]|jgi:cytochrome c oxidase subunit 2|nr:cytochrome C oxidase subunit II [Gammaproteobacteria bacterium]
MGLYSPSERIWWREPIAKTEIVWIILAFIWGLIMFFMMIYWHAVGEQNFSNESYRTTAAAFAEKANAMVAEHEVRKETVKSGGVDIEIPVVHPPPGSDVYLIARLWAWWPIIEFEKDQSYRLHISSMDWQHGFSLQPENINLQVHPGYDMVITVEPDKLGDYGIVCNEFCGIGHHTMVGKMYVVDK